jgi:predicted phage tail protein
MIAGAVLMYFTGNPMLFQVGLAMVIGGAAMLLVKAPKAPDPNSSAVDKPDKVFDGPTNVIAAGNAIPLLYGTMEVGSVVASAGIYTDDIEPLYDTTVPPGVPEDGLPISWDP